MNSITAAKLHYTEIPLEDSDLLDALTGALPDGPDLRQRLRRSFEGVIHRYYPELRTAFTIVADGGVAQCFEVCEVSQDEAARIAAGCDELDEWSQESFNAVIAEALGRIGNRVR